MTTEHLRPTKKQRQLLDYIEQFIAEHGYSPSYREIMNGLDYQSVATVALHVSSLIKRGHLRKRDHSARSLEVVNHDEPAARSPADSPVDTDHQAWLVNLVEQHVQALANDRQAGDQAVSDCQLLVSALRILGLKQQAATLETDLSKTFALSKTAQEAVY